MASYLIEGFIFRHGDSIILRRDPRVKLLLASFLIAIALLSNRPYRAVAAFAFIFGAAAVARAGERIAKLMITMVPFAALIFVINYLTGVGILASATEATWFVNIVTAASMFFITTSPDELEYVMRWMNLPGDFIFVFVTAVRFVPVLMLDFYSIVDAQKSRGLQVDVRSPIKWVRNLVPILIPLIVNAIMRSEQMAEAMEARGYGSVDAPTSMYRLRLNSGDYAMAGVVLVVCSAMIYFLLML